ncbi:MAG TPA: hypothetical protein PLK46_12365, partial [Propioniciclava sp.]|uniref:hypothetical protein n=1 Tax=Propioniciclava sp. TaxID=2038686 RepID=UPI002BD73920
MSVFLVLGGAARLPATSLQPRSAPGHSPPVAAVAGVDAERRRADKVSLYPSPVRRSAATLPERCAPVADGKEPRMSDDQFWRRPPDPTSGGSSAQQGPGSWP